MASAYLDSTQTPMCMVDPDITRLTDSIESGCERRNISLLDGINHFGFLVVFKIAKNGYTVIIDV